MARPDAYQTPPGVAVHPWINRPDTKFNANGVFHTQLALDASLPDVQTLMAKVTEGSQAIFQRIITEDKVLTPAEKKKWKLYVPFVMEEDAEGNETGRVLFTFKRNHKVTIRGEEKELHVAIYDSMGNDIPGDEEPAVFGGTVLSAAFTFRDVKVPGTKQAGAKLDFFAVQIIKLGQGGGGKVFGRATDPDETEGSGGYVFSSKPKAPPQDNAHVADGAEQFHNDTSEY